MAGQLLFLRNFMAIIHSREPKETEASDVSIISGLTNIDVWRESPLLWIVDNHIKNEKGQELEFKNHAFLKDILDDWTPVQAYNKASQLGFSTMMILKSFVAAKYRNWNIIYTLPTSGDAQGFVASKVNPIIQNNPLLAKWTKDKDTIEQKKLGNSFIYYRGTATVKSEKEKSEGGVGIIISSDWNVHDECDRSDQVALEQYESRLGNSQYKGRCFFSNPTHPKTLNQELYGQSTKSHWFIDCEHCGSSQYLDFFENIQDGQFVCSKCHGRISDDTRRMGYWVKEYQNREISGYWINHLMCPWITAKEIEDQYKTTSKAYFYNFVLGLPYAGSDILINADLILKCVGNQPNTKDNVVMGVDVGLTKHFVLMNHQGIFRVGTTDNWEDIDKLIRMWDVRCCVIDAMPDQTEPRKLRDAYPGKVYLCWFKREIKKADYITWDQKTRSVYCDRTNIIDDLIDSLVNRKIRYQVDPQELNTYVRHFESLYKIKETDNLGIERSVWESKGADHFVFATVYAMIALSSITISETEAVTYKPYKPIRGNFAPDINELAKRQ